MKKEKFGNKAGKKLQLFSNFKGVDYAHAPLFSITEPNGKRAEYGAQYRRQGTETYWL